jgi:alpha-glucosidase
LNGSASKQYAVGEFIVKRTASGLGVCHRQNSERMPWESAPDGNFIVAEAATADIRAFGEPQGAYEIRDTLTATYEQPTYRRSR